MTTGIMILLVLGGLATWKWGPRRRRGPGFEYVHVNLDGSVRELSAGEQDFVSRKFQGGDGGRPYFKMSYESRNGWGCLSGFMARRKVPPSVAIGPVNPDYDHAAKSLAFDAIALSSIIGDTKVVNPDGSITCVLNPGIPRGERFKLARGVYMENQRRREELAKYPP
jgi:hypothetical protein